MKPFKTEYKLVSKTIFFSKQEILAIGDLHLGYEEMLKQQGILLPFNQLEKTKQEIKKTIQKIKKQYKLKKIILLGDIKHHFEFQKKELFELKNFLQFLEKFISKKNIILIKGNHDTFTLKNYNLQDFYIQEELAFIHGHKYFEKIFKKSIKKIIMSHIHPAIILKDPKGIKKEKFKAFLIGKFKNKQIIIVPSFFPLIEGSEINEIQNSIKKFSIIPNSKLNNFKVFLIGKNKNYDFGKLKNLNKEFI